MIDLNKATAEEAAEIAQITKDLEYKNKYEKFYNMFPGTGPFKRSLYPKHLDFFRAGKDHRFRLFIAANRIGKTQATLYELTCHLTGEYPDWWKGKRFRKAVDVWVVGKNIKTTKDILQIGLLGEVGFEGSGMVPRKYIDFHTMTNAKKSETTIGEFRVMHKSGEFSKVGFKSYDMGRRAFEGTAKDIIVFDEEPPEDVYGECVLRTMTTNGLIIMNFTPLLGPSQVVLKFCENEDWTDGVKGPGKYLVRASWEDVPHLTPEQKLEMLAQIPDYLRDARTKGIPQLGEGQVYPVAEAKVFVPRKSIGKDWRRCFGMDFGWTAPTAILWGAIDPDDNTLYIYSEHYQKEKPPAEHVQAIIARNSAVGYKIPGVCDPSGGGRGIHDGKKAKEIYEREFGIALTPADNSKEPGILKVLAWLEAGKLKIFDDLPNIKKEYRMYRRNSKGEPVGEDHAMDALRYLVMSGFDQAVHIDTVGDLSDQILAARNVEESMDFFSGTEDSWYYS